MNHRKVSKVVSTVAVNVAFLATMSLALGGLACGYSTAEASDERAAAAEKAAPEAVASGQTKQRPVDARTARILQQLTEASWSLRDAVDEGDSFAIGTDGRINGKTYTYVAHVQKQHAAHDADMTTRMHLAGLSTYGATLTGPDGEKIEDPALVVHAAIQAMNQVSESQY